MPTLRAAIFAGLLAAPAAPRAFAQNAPTPPSAPAPAAQPGGGGAEPLPPATILGARADQVRRKLAVSPVVVIVSEVSAYVEAIGHWRLTARFPVLIDDGTPQARENIARFVRAFKPEKVVRWSPGKPAFNEWSAREDLITAAIGRAWTQDGKIPEQGFDQKALLALWKSLQLDPPGVVVAAKDDPAWTGAVALAAGRGQPIFWTTSTRKLDGGQTAAEADTLCKNIEAFCQQTGLSWKSLGDTLDAVTICSNMPQTVTGTASGIVALTDRVGRTKAGVNDTERWAWASQIPGFHAVAAYRAMSSLFLPGHSRAWLFDGHESGPGWDDFDASKADEVLKKCGWKTSIVSKPGGTLAAWRREAAKPLDADLLLVNTKGEKHQFHLASGTAKLGDIPILASPCVVNFLHSFSAQYLGSRDTLSGRWLERGAFGYVGSVDEPMLTGFLQTPVVAARFGLKFPLAAAPRYDRAPVWKITIIGDALYTFGAAAPAAPAVKLDGEVDLAGEVKEVIKADLVKGLWLLVMLGRDAEAARITTAMVKAGGEQFKAEAALPGALALFRTGRTAELKALADKLTPADLAKHPEVADAIALSK